MTKNKTRILLPTSCPPKQAIKIRRFCKKNGLSFSTITKEFWNNYMLDFENKEQESKR